MILQFDSTDSTFEVDIFNPFNRVCLACSSLSNFLTDLPDYQTSS